MLETNHHHHHYFEAANLPKDVDKLPHSSLKVSHSTSINTFSAPEDARSPTFTKPETLLTFLKNFHIKLLPLNVWGENIDPSVSIEYFSYFENLMLNVVLSVFLVTNIWCKYLLIQIKLIISVVLTIWQGYGFNLKQVVPFLWRIPVSAKCDVALKRSFVWMGNFHDVVKIWALRSQSGCRQKRWRSPKPQYQLKTQVTKWLKIVVILSPSFLWLIINSHNVNLT